MVTATPIFSPFSSTLYNFSQAFHFDRALQDQRSSSSMLNSIGCPREKDRFVSKNIPVLLKSRVMPFALVKLTGNLPR